MISDPIRVLSVDDHAFIAQGLATRIAVERDLEFVGSLRSAEGLITEVDRKSADVVLLDIEMPGPDPMDSLESLVRVRPDVRVIMLSAYVRDSFIDRSLRAGAWGYVSKSDDPDCVIDAVRQVMRGEFAFGPKVLERCSVDPRGASNASRPTSRLDGLTPREVQVLSLIGRGLSRVEIAHTLHRSPKTIDNHRAAIMEKLAIHDRVELARYAIKEGLAEL